VTVPVEFLRAGKTTLLKQVLEAAAGVRFGVRANDLGAMNIDAEVIVSTGADQVALDYAATELAIDLAVSADLLIINKCDLASPDAVQATIGPLTGPLPSLRYVETAFAAVPRAVLFGPVLRAPLACGQHCHDHGHVHAHDHHHHDGHQHTAEFAAFPSSPAPSERRLRRRPRRYRAPSGVPNGRQAVCTCLRGGAGARNQPGGRHGTSRRARRRRPFSTLRPMPGDRRGGRPR
jgi:G3E family GTPase